MAKVVGHSQKYKMKKAKGPKVAKASKKKTVK